MSTHLVARIVNTEVRASGRHKACAWMALRSICKTAAVHIRRSDVCAAEFIIFRATKLNLRGESGNALTAWIPTKKSPIWFRAH